MEVQIVGRDLQTSEENSQHKLVLRPVVIGKKKFINVYACDVGKAGESVESVMFYVDPRELLMAAEMLS